MDEQEDRPVGGDPGSDGNDKAGNMPFLPNKDPLDLEQGQETPDDLADEASELGEGLQEAADSVGDTQDEDTNPDIADLPEGELPENVDLSDEPEEAEVPTDIPVGEPPPIDFDFAVAPGITHTESPAVTAAEITAISDALGDIGGGVADDSDAFGERLNQFNEAGGADAPSVSDDDNGASDGPMGQFADAVTDYAKTSNDFLIDHARTLNELQRRLEGERL